MLCLAFRKCGMIEQDLRAVALSRELESNHRIDTASPVSHAPRLHDQLTGDEFEMTADMYPPNRAKAPPTCRLICVGLRKSRRRNPAAPAPIQTPAGPKSAC